MTGKQEYGVPDDDNPEWTKADFRNAKPFAEVFPGIAKLLDKNVDDEKSPVRLAAERYRQLYDLSHGGGLSLDEAVKASVEFAAAGVELRTVVYKYVNRSLETSMSADAVDPVDGDSTPCPRAREHKAMR